jgi:hypothetical protein
MSALPHLTDMFSGEIDVRYVPEAVLLRAEGSGSSG